MTKRVEDFRADGLLEHDLELAQAELKVEYRSHAGRKSPHLSGYAAVFDTPRRIQGTKDFTEVVRPGAFRESLAAGGGAVLPGSGVIGAWEHRGGVNEAGMFRLPQLFFGRTTVERGEGSLRVWEDERGLRFEGEPFDSEINRHYMRAIDAGVMHGASFLFEALEAPIVHTEKLSVRELRKVNVEDVSAVMAPAFPAASVAARSAALAARSVLPLLEGSGLTADEIERILAADLAQHRSHSGATPRRDDLARRVREVTLASLID